MNSGSEPSSDPSFHAFSTKPLVLLVRPKQNLQIFSREAQITLVGFRTRFCLAGRTNLRLLRTRRFWCDWPCLDPSLCSRTDLSVSKAQCFVCKAGSGGLQTRSPGSERCSAPAGQKVLLRTRSEPGERFWSPAAAFFQLVQAGKGGRVGTSLWNEPGSCRRPTQQNQNQRGTCLIQTS